MLQSAKFKQRSYERLVFSILAVVALVLAVSFWFLVLAPIGRKTEVGKYADGTSSPLIPPDHPRRLAAFSLTDCTGRNVTRSDLDGKILVVNFLFTSCSQTCPAINRCMAQIQKLTTNKADVILVSLTVDPRDDTVPVLAKYGDRFGADTNRWLFLTGEKASLYGLIRTSFLAQDSDDPFAYMPGNFSHTERIALVDRRGQLRGYFDGLNQNTAPAVVAEISHLRQ